MKLYFVTTNNYKVKEVKQYLGGTGLELQQVDRIVYLAIQICPFLPGE